MAIQFPVRGYVRPEESFFTLAEWEQLIHELLELQSHGIDTRGNEISCKHATYCKPEDFNRFVRLLGQYFNYQLNDEVDRWDLLTRKNVLDFIEDFVNHRFWALDSTYSDYFPDISKLKIAYFYSRGDLEPYVLLDGEYTSQLYGSLNNPMELFHFTSPAGLNRLRLAIESGHEFDISCFTHSERPFFRKESTLCIKLIGNVRAAFNSDIKSLVVNNGRRACNMHRLEYPGRDKNNICYDLSTCGESLRTNLWNEIIATPIKIIDITVLD